MQYVLGVLSFVLFINGGAASISVRFGMEVISAVDPEVNMNTVC